MLDYAEEARYLTDDRDEKERNELIIYQGGNGDWYVGVVPEGEAGIGKFVRLCTSGGASFAAPGLCVAISDAYRAIRGLPKETEFSFGRKENAMLKHTPGPWRNDPEIGMTFGPEGTAIQTGGGGCAEEFRANAVLIAAAPDMLESLLLMRDLLDPAMRPELVVRLREEAIRSIAKATGGSGVES